MQLRKTTNITCSSNFTNFESVIFYQMTQKSNTRQFIYDLNIFRTFINWIRRNGHKKGSKKLSNNTFNTWRQKLTRFSALISPNYCVNGIIQAVPKCIRIQILCLISQITRILEEGIGNAAKDLTISMHFCKHKTSELALEYMISSALRTTMGSFSCHSLFFLVAEL